MSTVLQLTTSAAAALWEDAYEQLSFTAFALATQGGDEELAELFEDVRGVLADWEAIERDRRALRARAIEARAHVKVADAALDRTLTQLAETIIAHEDGERGELYASFFPEPHERLVALGLEGELPGASLAMAMLDEGGEVPDPLVAYIGPLRACLTAGTQALTGRADAYADLGRLQARTEAWLETAGAVRATVQNALAAIAEERGLSDRFASGFFP